MDSTEALLTAWRDAEAAVDAAEPGTTAWREARVRGDIAKTAYLTRLGDVFDVEGHTVFDPAPPADEPSEPSEPSA